MAVAESIQTTNQQSNTEYWQERVRTYLRQTGMSQSAFARALGVSPAAVTQYLNGTYLSMDKMNKRVAEFFDVRDDAEKLHVSADYVPTSISEEIYDTIRSAHLKGGLACECGDPGIGKTKAAHKYAVDYPNTTVLVTVNPAFANCKSFLKLLCRACRLHEGSKDDMYLNALDFFKGSRRVLIVDEAQHLSTKTIELIRFLADEVPTLGIVFIGNRRLATIMSGKLESEFAQIISRTKIRRIRLTTHILLSDIKLLFPDIKEGRALEYLLGVAQSKQGLRGAANLYSNACDNEDTTYEGLVAMAKHMQMIL